MHADPVVALLPCPHCGAQDDFNPSVSQSQKYAEPGDVATSKVANLAAGLVPGGWYVECDECGACGGHDGDRSKAVALWNTRTPAPAGDVRETLRALEAACDDLAANRSAETYHNMVHCDRAMPYLLALDEARRDARELLRQLPDACSVCGGDCNGANPPVMFCPMRDAASPTTDSSAVSGSAEDGVSRIAIDIRSLRDQMQRIADRPPNDQPAYHDGVRPFGTGDLRHFIETLDAAAAALTEGQQS